MRSSFVLGLLGTALSVSAEVNLEKYRLRVSPEYTKASEIDPGLRSLKTTGGYVDIAKDLVKSVAPGAEFRVLDGHYEGTDGMGHVYFVQTSNGVDIDNAMFNVNVKDGKVFSYGNSFFKGTVPLKKTGIDAVKALEITLDTLTLPLSTDGSTALERRGDDHFEIRNVAGTKQDPSAKLVYVVKPDGELALAWKVKTRTQLTSLSSYVDAAGEDVVGVVNHVSHAAYEVYPYPINDPREGERAVVKEPSNADASKSGWHDDSNRTSGNNIVAAARLSSTQDVYAESANLTFQYPYEPDTGDVQDFVPAAVTQAFYTTNMLHDLYYLLGFTPAAGNFQLDNHGEGGLANDPVNVFVQHHRTTNNGQFFQDVDGKSAELAMYVFTMTDPFRDGGFDQGFITHEYTHGLSERLTGGPSVLGCLNDWEADGMAEGWSDLYAAALTLKPSETRDNATYGFAAWPTNSTDPPTARLVMYSTDMEVNPWTYSTVNDLGRAHEVGTAWATMLYEVLWNLIDKHGRESGFWPEIVDGVPSDGKYLMLKLLLDAFAIQPCNPTFVQARDAILDADIALTGGDNHCEIWTGFAKRGLGEGAISTDQRVDDFTVPEGIC